MLRVHAIALPHILAHAVVFAAAAFADYTASLSLRARTVAPGAQ
jgi:hypothetical protein